MENTNKKEISEKTAIRAIITGFVSYGILIGFIFSVVLITLIYFSNNTEFSNEIAFKISTSIIISIFIYIFIHLICKLSNIDLLRKCKIDKNKEINVCKKLNLFYLLCTLFFVLIIIVSLYVKFSNQLYQINISYQQYLNDFSNTDFAYDFANNYKDGALEEFYHNRKTTLIAAVIIEMGLFYSFISLIPYQKKMLNIYNKS